MPDSIYSTMQGHTAMKNHNHQPHPSMDLPHTGLYKGSPTQNGTGPCYSIYEKF